MLRPEWIQAASLNHLDPKVFRWMELTSKHFSFVFICFHLILTYLQEERLKAWMAELEAKLQAHARQEIEIIWNPKSWYLRGSNKNIDYICFSLYSIWCLMVSAFWDWTPWRNRTSNRPKMKLSQQPRKRKLKETMPRPEWIQVASLNRLNQKFFCWMGLTLTYFSFVFICFHLILTYLQEERLKARMAELEAKLQAQARREIEIIRNPNWYLQEYRPILFPSFIAFDVWSFLYFETEPLEELEHQIDPKCSWASGPGKGSWKRPCRGQNGSKQLLLTVSTRWVFCWKGLTLT